MNKTHNHHEHQLAFEQPLFSNSEHVGTESGLECSPSPHSPLSRNWVPTSSLLLLLSLFHFALLSSPSPHIVASFSAKMEDSSAAVSRPKAGIGDLPDEVFVLILMLLPFPDQVRVRRVSTYWRTAVHFVFSKQETIRISLQEKETYEPEVREYELDLLGFNFNSGVNVVITYPPKMDPPDECVSPRIVVRDTECPVKREAITRFCSTVAFAIQYLNGVRIAEISWGFKCIRSLTSVTDKVSILYDYGDQDLDRLHDVCNRFALRFQHQLLCFVCPMFNLTSDHFFPVLKHVTLRSVSRDIRDMFRTVTPKLVSLLTENDDGQSDFIHGDNFRHLPADFRCITLPGPWFSNAANERLTLFQQLQRCRTAIQSIHFAGWRSGEEHSRMHFPNLRFLRMFLRRRTDWDMRENILTMNAAGLHHLQLFSALEISYHFPSHVMFQNLQSLTFSGSGSALLDILSRTSHRLHTLTIDSVWEDKQLNLVARLSKIRFLTRLEIVLGPHPGLYGEKTPLQNLVLMLLRGGSRSTLKYFWFGNDFTINEESGKVAAEMRLMQESESLLVGGMYHQMLTA